MDRDSEGVIVREATHADAAIIAGFNCALAMESEGVALDIAKVRQGIDKALDQSSLCRYFVAEIDGGVVGQTMVTYEWSDWQAGILWWIQSVYVHPAYRGRGVFAAIYRRIAEMARRQRDSRGIRLYVHETNVRAMAVYRHLGMAPTGDLVYGQDWSDAESTGTAAPCIAAAAAVR